MKSPIPPGLICGMWVIADGLVGFPGGCAVGGKGSVGVPGGRAVGGKGSPGVPGGWAVGGKGSPGVPGGCAVGGKGSAGISTGCPVGGKGAAGVPGRCVAGAGAGVRAVVPEVGCKLRIRPPTPGITRATGWPLSPITLMRMLLLSKAVTVTEAIPAAGLS